MESRWNGHRRIRRAVPTARAQAPLHGLLGAVPFTLNPKTLRRQVSPGNCPGLVGGPVGNIGPVGDATPYPAEGGSPRRVHGWPLNPSADGRDRSHGGAAWVRTANRRIVRVTALTVSQN